MQAATEAAGDFEPFLQAVSGVVPETALITDYPRRLAFGTDASFYRLIPRLVVLVSEERQVSAILSLADRYRVPITFRAAGTSLSGQAVTDAVLLKLDQRWVDHEVLDGGQKIRLQPGLTGAQANRVLAPFGRKIGPDPASIRSAMIGGIAANNASGMCCGTDQNSYRTIDSMRLVLHDGFVLDTADTRSRERFRKLKPELYQGLKTLRDQVLAEPDLAELITRKFRIKNTTGYSLNALVDFDDPITVLEHLLIGSEGTLGFIAEVTYRTVPEHAHKATSLVFYADVHRACEVVQQLSEAPVDAVELIDRASLRSIENRDDIGINLRDLPEGTAALLVETRAGQAEALGRQIDKLLPLLSAGEPLFEASFSRDAAYNESLWNIRKGLFPAVGHVRPVGTTVIIEDVAFPMARLAEAIVALQGLFKVHGYDEAIIFGHALAGNVHFVFSQNFDDPQEVKRYAGFMSAVSALVADRFGGSLKAEHGTGRNMAPFVEMEWGRRAYQLMRDIKQLLDPQRILNPGVLLSDDPELHIRNLKPMPEAHPVVDKCIECGFCEVTCPSKNLSVTPRQRIVLWREITRRRAAGEPTAELASLEKAFAYLGDETCATDGLCATLCPVDIDTGRLIKDLRRQGHSQRAQRTAQFLGRHLAPITRWLGWALGLNRMVQRLLGPGFVRGADRALSRLSGGRAPHWPAGLPGRAGFEPVRWVQAPARPKVVYLPSCLNRTFGAPEVAGNSRPDNLPDVIARVLQRAGFDMVYPDGLAGLCCGKTFEGKGFTRAETDRQVSLAEALDAASERGRLPILCDTSPCLMLMREKLPDYLQLFEPIAFAERFLLDRLSIRPKSEPVLLHLTCSARRMGLAQSFESLARRCAQEVVIPPDVACCGFAGDKGFFTPELNASALESLTPDLSRGCEAGYSTSITCEIGLTDHTGVPYRSLFYLLDEVSRPLDQPAPTQPGKQHESEPV